MGSIPINSIIIITFKYKLFFKIITFKNNSLIQCFNLSNYRFQQIYLLNTYILWLFIINYLKSIQKTKFSYYYANSSLKYTAIRIFKIIKSEINIRFSFFIKKKTSKVFTMLKSPMAQKKFSKEQVGFRYYNLTVIVYITTPIISGQFVNIKNPDSLYFFLLLIKNEIFLIFCGLFLLNGCNVQYFFKYQIRRTWLLESC